AAAIGLVYVTLHATGQFELPLAYFHLDGDLFNLPAGPVSFAAGLEYRGERWRSNPDSENTSFDTIGATDFEASKVNRDVWGTYQEVRIPMTSPAWKLPGAYSLEFGLAEREEWYSQNTSATSVLPAQHSQFDALKPEVAYEWSYGAVYSPKWIRGLTLSADFWHIDLRSIASSVDPQFIVTHENFFPQDVIRDPTTGAITDVINPSLNLTRAVVEGLDYEAIYILNSAIFGRGDFGKFTFTLNGTYLSRFEFQATPDSHRIGLSGGFPV